MSADDNRHDVPEGLIPGFERQQLPGDGIVVDALVGGKGPPLLLLHGYPQTRMVWRAVATGLREHFTLVIPDLRGYGRSDKPADDPQHQTYAKRRMALDHIATMSALGFDRFHVAGHDRGARVAYRLALDHPANLRRLVLIDILPTSDVFEAPAAAAMSMFHWPLTVCMIWRIGDDARSPRPPSFCGVNMAQRMLAIRWPSGNGGRMTSAAKPCPPGISSLRKRRSIPYAPCSPFCASHGKGTGGTANRHVELPSASSFSCPASPHASRQIPL